MNISRKGIQLVAFGALALALTSMAVPEVASAQDEEVLYVTVAEPPQSDIQGPYEVTVSAPGCDEKTEMVTVSRRSERATFRLRCQSSSSSSSSSNGSTQNHGSNGSAYGDASGLTAENIRLNSRGNILADIVWKSGARPERAMVKATFEWGDPRDPDREEVRVSGVQYQNRARPASTRAAFPCDATYPVSVSVEPLFGGGEAGVTKVQLSRTCSRTQGTPNLIVENLERTNGGLESASYTPVKVRVTVKNDSNYDMPDNEMGGTAWSVQVIGMSPNPYTIRRALKANEKYSFNVNVAVACGEVTDVAARVDVRNNIMESEEDDNEGEFPVEGNACQDAG